MTRGRRPAGFADYRAHLRTRAGVPPPRKPGPFWWDSTESSRPNDVERLFLARFGRCPRILDFGSGDNRLQRRYRQARIPADFRTFDLSREFEHDYDALDEVRGPFDCVFMLEVIEERRSLGQRGRLFLKKVLTTQILGVDYADGIIVIGRRRRGD